MKSRVRNLLMTIFALLTAVFLGLSILLSKPLELSKVANAGNKAEVIDATEALGNQLDSTQFMDSDLLS